MRINAAVITAFGKVKRGNQDNYFVNNRIKNDFSCQKEEYFDLSFKNENVYAVFDGMDGEECGDVASFICARTLQDFFTEGLGDNVDEYIKTANRLVCGYSEEHCLDKSGSTLALVHIRGNIADIYNIGDSRIYLFRKGALSQLSYDHTNVRRLVNIGVLTEEQARRDPGRHSLSQHIGIPEEEMVVEAHKVCGLELAVHDRMIICSDGLTDFADDPSIGMILADASDTKEAAERLVGLAYDLGGKDNVTVIVIDIN